MLCRMSAAVSEPRPASRLRAIAPGLAAAALAVLVYATTLGHGFAYDDTFILRSPLLAHPWSLSEVFSGGFYAPHERTLGLYRPLGQWSLVLNAALARSIAGSFDHPAIFHAVNVLLHAAASFLVFLWLSRLPLLRSVAGAAAILWAVHPVHAEVAANVTARYESTAAVLGLAFLIAHRSRRGVLAGLLFLAALGCKESAIALLPLALAVDALLPVEGRRFDLRACVPAVGALALWCLLRGMALSGDTPATPFVENPIASASLAVRVPTAAKVQLLYLRDQILPLWLSTDHSYQEIGVARGFLDPACLGFAAIVAAALFAAWRLRTNRPEVALAVAGYAILLAPASNFLLPVGTIMADRLAYLPSIFTCLLAAILLSGLRSRAVGGGVAVLAAGLLSVASFAQARVWKDDLTLFREQVQTAPGSAKSHGNLGNALREKGELRAAVNEYKKSIAIYPYWPEPYLGLAQAYEFLDESPELLIDTWADAIRYGTVGKRPMLVRALALVDLGRWSELIRLRGEMGAVDPEDPFLVRVDRILHAAERLMRTPTRGEDWARGTVLFRMGDWAGAEEKYRVALHRGALPGDRIAQTLLDLAQCHENLGQPLRAKHFRALAAEAAAHPR
jgi:tetratricopeptide (TPR) repeat protein